MRQNLHGHGMFEGRLPFLACPDMPAAVFFKFDYSITLRNYKKYFYNRSKDTTGRIPKIPASSGSIVFNPSRLGFRTSVWHDTQKYKNPQAPSPKPTLHQPTKTIKSITGAGKGTEVFTVSFYRIRFLGSMLLLLEGYQSFVGLCCLDCPLLLQS